MICYLCEHCGADMASPDCMAGKSDTCPKCGRSTVAPIDFKCIHCGAYLTTTRGGLWVKCQTCGKATKAPPRGDGPQVGLPGVETDAQRQAREAALLRMRPPPSPALAQMRQYAQAAQLNGEDAQAPSPCAERIYTKIRGVTFRNADGGERQTLIRQCRARQQVLLAAEPDNPHDPNAVAVLTMKGEMLGYVGADLARDLSGHLLAGQPAVAAISEITGDGVLGVNLLVLLYNRR